MRKNLLLLCALVTCQVGLAQRTLDLNTMEVTQGIQNAMPTRDVEEVADGVLVTYRFSHVVMQDDPLYSGAAFALMGGFWTNAVAGQPATLSRWDTFLVPNGEAATVTVTDSAFVEIPMELSPARPVLGNGSNEGYTTDNVLPISPYSGRFPGSLLPALRVNQYRGQSLKEVCVCPIQYDYAQQKLRVFSMIQYKVQYGAAGSQQRTGTIGSSNSTDTFLRNIAVNGSTYMQEDNSSKGTRTSLESVSSSYLIVSTPTFAAAANRLAEWKRTLGYHVMVDLRTSWDTTTVKSAVNSAYSSNSIEHLLIIGAQDDVPGCIRELGDFVYPTDLYYGCPNGGYTPSIYRGRIPVRTTTDAEVVVDKIINYEKNPVADASFYNTGVHCAEFRDINNDSCEDHRFVLTSERMRDYLLNGIGKNVSRIYYTPDSVTPTHWNNNNSSWVNSYAYGESLPDSLLKPGFAWDGDSADIIDGINQKAFYVLYRGHGDYCLWRRPNMSNTDISSLINGKYLPVVFSICCKTGKFNVNNNFCETFLKKNNGGCVAIYGATEVSYSGLNDVLAEGMFDAIWPSDSLWPHFGIIGSINTSAPTPTYQLGQILDQGLIRVDEAYSVTDYRWASRYTHELFHCFGDPSMMICTAQPTAFSGASIVRQNGTITVNTGGETARISYYNRRTGAVEAYLGTSDTHTDDPELSVCISGHNKIPYLDGGTLYIQNQTLTVDGYYDAGTIKVGNHVTTTLTQGDVNFNNGVHHLTGVDVELHPGTTISVGAEVEINKNE